MKTLVIIPCYNEEENLDRVVERLQASVAGQALPGQVDYLDRQRLLHRRQRRAVQRGRGLQLHFPAGKPWHRRRRAERVLVRRASTAMTSPCRWTATASTTPPASGGRGAALWREGEAGHVHRQPLYHEGGLSDELPCGALGIRLHQRADPPSVRRARAGRDQRVPRHAAGALTAFFARPLRAGLPGAGGHYHRPC